MKRKKFISKVCATVVAFAMAFSLINGITVQAAEEPQEKSVTFEVTPTSINASDTHNLGSLNAFFGMYDTLAESNIASFTIRSSEVPAGATISRIEVKSSVSNGSTGSIYVYVGKDEDNGDGTFDRYIDNMPWSNTLNFYDFGNYNLSPVGIYYIQFASIRYSTGTIAAATLNSIIVTVYYY